MTSVSVRKRKTKAGNVYLCLDYYPPLFNPRTRRYTSRESLGLRLYANPRNDRERRFNDQLLEKAEAIRCKRIIQIINEEYDFLDKDKYDGDFLEYYRAKVAHKDEKSFIVYGHFKKFMDGKCTFGVIDTDLCNRFREYLLKSVRTKGNRPLAQNSAAGYFASFRCILKEACKGSRLDRGLSQQNVCEALENNWSKSKDVAFKAGAEALIEMFGTTEYSYSWDIRPEKKKGKKRKMKLGL